MPKLGYPVVVRQIGSAVGANVPDFRWQLVGADAADAVIKAERALKAALEDCERRGSPPPKPSVVSVTYIEFADYRGPLPISVLRTADRS
jgi:hypothetical protein